MMNNASVSKSARSLVSDRFLHQLVWWFFLLICVVYAAYAFDMAVVELLFRTGIMENAPQRAVPLIFIIHALSGGVALLSGILQFNRRLLMKKRKLHRMLGRVYVGAIWISSAAGLWVTIFFDVSIVARLILGTLAILWFSTTTVAFLCIRKRKIASHREWMIRSFALSLFFVTFSLWVPGLAATSLPKSIGYPVAVFLSWSLNLLAAEVWIHRTRSQLLDVRLQD